MNQVLFDFYEGIGVDVEQRTFNQMLTMEESFIEKSHTVIQWLFPLLEPSLHNRKAPLLDEETIEAMKASKVCMDNLASAYFLMVYFLFTSQQDSDKPYWLRLRNHNYLRITRMIKCLRLFGREDLATDIYDRAMALYFRYPNIVGEETSDFWTEAMQ